MTHTRATLETVRSWQVAEDLPDTLRADVKVKERCELGSQKMLGILWPTALYTAKFKRNPDKSELSRIMHCGEWITGVILSEDKGRPIGAYKPTQNSVVEHYKETTIASSDTACRGRAQVDEIFASMEKRYNMAVKVPTSDDEGAQLWSKYKLDADDPLDQQWKMPFDIKAKAKATPAVAKPPKPSGWASIAGVCSHYALTVQLSESSHLYRTGTAQCANAPMQQCSNGQRRQCSNAAMQQCTMHRMFAHRFHFQLPTLYICVRLTVPSAQCTLDSLDTRPYLHAVCVRCTRRLSRDSVLCSLLVVAPA